MAIKKAKMTLDNGELSDAANLGAAASNVIFNDDKSLEEKYYNNMQEFSSLEDEDEILENECEERRTKDIELDKKIDAMKLEEDTKDGERQKEINKIVSDLAAVEVEDGKIETRILGRKDEDDTLQENIDNTSPKFNAITTASANGTSVTLNNSADFILRDIKLGGNASQSITPSVAYTKGEGDSEGVISFDATTTNYRNPIINGNSYQDTTEGYNLLNSTLDDTTISGIDIIKNEDNTYKITGNTTDIITIDLGSTSLEANTQYKLNNIGEGITFSTTETSDALFTLIMPIDTSIDATIKPMITSDLTKTYNDYEKFTYGPSPNPDYPQDIEVISTHDEENKYNLEDGHIGLRQTGKNLIKYPYNGDFNQTINNLTIKTNPDNSITVNGTATATTVLYFRNIKAKYKPSNGTYTFVCKNSQSLVGSYSTFQPCIGVNESGTISEKNDFDGTGKQVTITDNVQYIYMHIAFYNGATFNNLTLYPMLLAGSEVKPYEPYHEPILHDIDLNGNYIAKIKDTDIRDVLSISNKGEVSANNKIIDFYLTGNENWTYYAEGKVFFTDDYKDLMNTGYIYFPMCNYLIGRTWGNNDNTIMIDEVGRLHITNYNITNIDDLKTWLSTSKPEVLAIKSTPQTISLPTISPIQMWEGYNKFELLTNLGTNYSIEYNGSEGSPSTETPNLLVSIDNMNITVAAGSVTDSYPVTLQKPFYKLGTAQDNLEVSKGAWHENHEVGIKQLTGSENWTAAAASGIYTFTTDLSFGDTTATSNVFQYSATDTSGNKFYLKDSKLNIVHPVVNGLDITTLDDWKSYLSSHDVYIYYIYPTAVSLAVTTAQKKQLAELYTANTYESKTVVSNNVLGVQPDISVEYYNPSPLLTTLKPTVKSIIKEVLS